MRNPRVFVCTILFAAAAGVLSVPLAFAQGQGPRVFERASASVPARVPLRALRSRHVRAATDAIAQSDVLVLNLFDDLEVSARRTRMDRPRGNSFVWQGRVEGGYEGTATFAVTDGVVAGTVFLPTRTIEIHYGGNGVHEIREIDPHAYPTEDPGFELVPDLAATGQGGQTITSADGGTQIDVMVVWTPGARNAAGGVSAIQSLVDLAVANANATYANSLVGAQLRLVYSGEVVFTETPSNIMGDLSALTSTNDGKLDGVHTLRNQYGADIVTLLGAGYTSGGYCGIGYLMGSPSTSFASYAFNVVDRSCAAGNLSYAHEVGHNQGLHHDPANASGSPAYSYAYGYQDPGGAFRTVMSYGGAPRVTQLSNPSVLFSGRPTGTSTQNNASALNSTKATVAAFRSSSTGGGEEPPAPTPTCTFSVSPGSLSFSTSGGVAQVQVSAPSGCGWSAQDSSTWVSLSTSGGSGSGLVAVTVAQNTGKPRSASIAVAGTTVSISQKGVRGGGGGKGKR